MDTSECLVRLRENRRYRLADVAAAGIEPLPGIYALWNGQVFLYVGIARVDPSSTQNLQARGVPGRLGTYERSRLTSDFSIAVAFRFVVPTMTDTERRALTTGEMSVRDVQARVRSWVHEHVEFSTVICDAPTAITAEKVARTVGLPTVGPPAFNPI